MRSLNALLNVSSRRCCSLPENAGISVGQFINLFTLYLRSLFVEFHGKLHTQKDGICIGAGVTLVLSDIFLSKLDRAVRVTSTGGSIRFLEPFLFFFDAHVCWAYRPNSTKGLLAFRSGRTKIKKRGIIISGVTGAITSSWSHLMGKSLDMQVSRLKQAGFPLHLILFVLEYLVARLGKDSLTVGPPIDSKK